MIILGQKITYEEFIKRLKDKTDTIIPVSEYIGWNKPMVYQCLDCGNEWKVSAARSVPCGYGCPECANKVRANKLRILSKSRVKSEEQFRKELSIVQPNLIPNDTYVNDRTKYHCICKIHNCDVYKSPEKLLRRNQGCNLCSIERNKCATRYTDESFKQKALSFNSNLIFLSDYQSIKSPIKVQCKKCGYIWNPVAEVLIREEDHCGCPKCAGNAILTPDEFKSRLQETHPELTLLSDYVRSNQQVHVQCNDCGFDFWIIPNKLQQGQHCPHCKISNGERLIKNYLDKNEIEYTYNKKYDGLIGIGGRQLSYDFYLPEYNVLIEMQGIQHVQPVDFTYSHNIGLAETNFKKQQEHDKRKREYAATHNIPLLEIWYDEIDHVDSILDSYLQIKKIS